MSSTFCSMEEAFLGPLVASGGAPLFPGQKPLKHKRRKEEPAGREGFAQARAGSGLTLNHPTGGEGFAVPPLPDRQVTPPPAPEVLKGPTAEEQRPSGAQLDSGNGLQDFFPLPGETAGDEEWTKAFTLEPSNNPGIPVPRFDGSISVAGKPTLWRQIAAPHVAANELAPAAGSLGLAPAPSEITQRLDTLTRQLESLTTPSAAQGTAELFLFVAIGLLLLLAIDTLLRFATSVAQRGSLRGGFRAARKVRFRA